MSEYTPPEEESPVYYKDPPVRDTAPASSGLVGAVGIIALIAVIVVASGGLDGKNKPSPKGDSPRKVSMAGAKPCVLNDSPRIRLNSPKRLDACKKAKQYAKSKLSEQFDSGHGKQFKCLDELWTHESAWSPWAINTDSGAAGIPQALGHGHVFDEGDWKAQVKWGLRYIKNRYETPCNAWSFWQRTDSRPYPGNWY